MKQFFKDMLKSIIIITIFIVIIIIFQSIPSVVDYISNRFSNKYLNIIDNSQCIQIILQLIYMIPIIIFLKNLLQKKYKLSLKVGKYNLSIFFIFGLLYVSIESIEILAEIAFYLNKEQLLTHINTNIQILVLLSLFINTLLDAIMEELVFRGYIYNLFKKDFNIKTATIISSLMFSIVHISNEISIFTYINLFISGIFFVIMMELTNSIYSSISMHAFYNALVFMIDYIFTGNIEGTETLNTFILNMIPLLLTLFLSWIIVESIIKKKRMLIIGTDIKRYINKLVNF